MLPVSRHERRSVLLAAALLFLVELSEALAANAADSLYLGAFGASGFGVVLAASSLSLLVTLAVAGGIADRTERSTLVARLCLGGGFVLLGLRGLAFVTPALAPAPLVILSKQLAAAVDLGVWVLLADRFDARQGRRLFPLLLAAGGVGSMVGSVATRALVEVFGAPDLFFAAALALALATPFAVGLGQAGPLRQRKHAGSILGAIPGSLEAARRSELARRLAVVVAVAGGLGLLLHTALGAAAAETAGTPEALAAFFGRYRAVVSLAALVAQFTLGPWLIARAGVAAALLVAPIVAALSGWAMAFRGDLLTAAIAQGATRVLDAAVQTPAERVALNLLPRDLRGRAAALLEGVAKRGGSLIGGLAATALVSLGVGLGGAVLASSALWLAAAGALARRYGGLAATELAGRRGRRVEASPLDEGTRRRLRRDLSRGDDRQAALAAAVLAREAPREATAWLLEAAATASPARRSQLLKAAPVAAAAPGRAWRAAAALFARRAELTADERALVVRALARLAPKDELAAHSPELVVVARDDGSAAVRLAARVEVLRLAGDLDDVDEALDEATRPVRLARSERDAAAMALLAGLRGMGSLAPGRAPDPDEDPGGILLRATALAELTQLAPTGRPRILATLLRLVADGDPDEQEGALVALNGAARAGWGSGEIAPAAAAALERRGGPAEVRAAAADALGWCADAADAAALGRALGDPVDDVRDAAVAALARLGARGAPVLLVAARHGRRGTREAAIEALGELPLEPAMLDAWIEAELGALEDTVRRRAALEELGATDPGRLLGARLAEREKETAATLVAVLEARHGDPRIAVVGDRILGSVGRLRARALEALDALLPRQVALRLVPLLDDLSPRARAERLGQIPAVLEAAAAELAGGDVLARRFVTLAALGSGLAPLRAAVREVARKAMLDSVPDSVSKDGSERSGAPLRSEHPVLQEDDPMPTAAETILALSRVPLFAELTPGQLGALADAAAWESHPAGAVVVGGGGEGESALYQVHSGELRVERGEIWESIPAGGTLGERTLVLPEETLPRVVAGPRTRVVRLAPLDFARVVDDHPQIALAVARVLARR